MQTRVIVFKRPVVRIVIRRSDAVAGHPRWLAHLNDDLMAGAGETEAEAIAEAVRLADQHVGYWERSPADTEPPGGAPTVARRILVGASFIAACLGLAALISWTLLGWPQLF